MKIIGSSRLRRIRKSFALRRATPQVLRASDISGISGISGRSPNGRVTKYKKIVRTNRESR